MRLRACVGIYILFFAIYSLSTLGHFISSDHIEMYLMAEALAEHRSLTITPFANTITTPDGRTYSAYAPAQAVLSIPLYLTGKLVDQLASPEVKRYLAGPDLGPQGGTVKIFFVSLFNQFITPLNCVLVLLFCLALGFSTRVSFLTSLIFGIGTQTWPYTREYFQHPLETLSLLGTVYILYTRRERLTAGATLSAGALLGLGVLTRANLLSVIPVLGVYVLALVLDSEAPQPARVTGAKLSLIEPAAVGAGAVGAAKGGRPPLVRAATCLVLFGLPIVVAVAITAYLNWLRYGAPSNFGPEVTPGFSTALWVGVYGYLFSLGRSIFLYSPPLVLTLFTYRRFYREHPREALLVVCLALVYLSVYARYVYWDAGWGWGPRYMLALVPFLMLPVAYALSDRLTTLFLAIATALGMVVQVLGIVVNYNLVHWDWHNAGLTSHSEYLFVPELSAIPAHWHALQQRQHLDTWLWWVYTQFGPRTLLLTLLLPAALLAVALWLLRGEYSAGNSIRG